MRKPSSRMLKKSVHKRVANAAMKGHLTVESLQKKVGLDKRYQPAVIEVAEKIKKANVFVGNLGAPGRFAGKWGKRIIILSGAFTGLRVMDVKKEIEKTNKQLKEFNELNQKVNPGVKKVIVPFKEKITDAIKNTEFRIAVPDVTQKKPFENYIKGPGGSMVVGGVATALLMVFLRNKIRNQINYLRAKRALKRNPVS
jgi:hypothetical protein